MPQVRKATLAKVIITPLTMRVTNAGTRRSLLKGMTSLRGPRGGSARPRMAKREQQAGDTDDVEDGAPAEPLTDDAADGLAGGAADEHACGEDRLRASAVGLRIAAGDHRLRGGGVGGFADADEGAGEKQHREGVDVAGEDGGEAPEE